jgi:predicted nucleotide-binding protein (sugar kinase/HSP70/actin superfamily)
MYWRYGRRILQAAYFIAKHPRLHAVFLTNFGCGPDSFLQTYVEHIMKGKPMLMLELDEHSADAGYITRLEAFRDVIAGEEAEVEIKAERKVEFVTGIISTGSEETMWVPPMHPYGTTMLAAALRSVGTNAKPMPSETIESFTAAKAFCRGTECVPAPATIGAFLDVLKRSDAPEKQVLFMPSAKGPCRFGQYNTLHRLILDEAGYPDTRVEAWDDESGTYGTDAKTSSRLYSAMLASDLLYKVRCRVRPYAADREGFDRVMREELGRTEAAAETGKDLGRSLAESARRISALKTVDVAKPLVGIVGEIYVRCNTFTNGNLVETIEDAGGEAWLAPVTEWFQYLSFLDTIFAKEERMGTLVRIKKGLKNAYMMRQGKTMAARVSSVIGDRMEPPISSTLEAGSRYLPKRFDGESILTIGRAVEFAGQGVDMIINCAPFGCMPGTLTAGIFQRIEDKLGVPIVSLFFDGETDLTHLVRTYLTNITAKDRGASG